MTKTKAQDSEAARQARTELRAIVRELQAIKERLLATEKRLRAAEGTAAVVEVDPEGVPCTMEGWTADLIGDEVPDILDDLLSRVARAADPDAVRAGIREFVEAEREHAAKHAAKA
jgi:hypothetical protein